MNNTECFYDAWREDFQPSGSLPCDTCSLAESGSRIIWGEGNPDSDIWILLDNPGMREDVAGVPFVCGTRQTIHSTAREFGFTEHSLYVTYVVRRRPVRKYPKDVERKTCIRNFHIQISTHDPKIIFCMGDVALSSLLGVESHVKDMRGKSHRWQDYTLLTTYHPLAVRRRPNLASNWSTDWNMLRNEFTNASRAYSIPPS